MADIPVTALSLPLVAAAGIEVTGLVIGLFGGLAVFLYGLAQMADALKTVAGDRMRAVLARLTRNPLTAALTGAFVTAVIQSSSVTTVIVVGFVSAGLMSLGRSVGVIMGANVGTTVTAQVIAFRVESYALAIVAIGVGLHLFGRTQRARLYGTSILGLGLVFLGMTVMGDAMAPLRSYTPFLDLMARLESPLLGILAGAIFTAVVQSSSATTGVVIVLATQGLVSLPASVALVLGANVGTCVTALLAAVGKPREAVRAAAVHVIFNLLGVVLWVGFTDALAGLVTSISPPGDLPREVANAHTIFNVTNTIVLLPLAPLFARIVERLIPDRPQIEDRRLRARFLEDGLLGAPALALHRARLEVLRIGRLARRMLGAALPAMLDGRREDIESVAALDDRVDALHGQVVTYLGHVSQARLTEEQTAELVCLMETANNLESIGDVIETNLMRLASERLDAGVRISDATRNVLSDFHAEVARALDQSLRVVGRGDPKAARAVRSMKPEINRMAAEAAAHGADRLVAPEPHRLPAYRIETDMVENLKRVYYHVKRIARTVLDA